ncbi:enoyl-coa hydratase-related [Holotrichia oblita]|uniref:Enoyl-coa hydratase-related n=1 Tax=Holotrichia oblita TaxID=644536 RepID=A0ACB9TXQ2_HOLOL|nr:enoyl-coa hydratase-related [Holotrichia oblita]
MASKIFVRPISIAFNAFRNYSSSSKLVDVSINDKTGIATVTMQRPPVNSLNYELLIELNGAFQDLGSKKIKGAILTSSLKTIFSAGLDILEMYKPKPERANAFWTSLQDTWITIFNTPYPTVAAINGHSPAGGCLLSLACEYRVMVNNYTIGLNETKLGIVAPFWFVASMKNTISNRESELALTSGRLYKTDEAFKVGLVDETAENKEDALAKAEKFFSRFDAVNPIARFLTKQELRGKIVKVGRKTFIYKIFRKFQICMMTRI